MNGWIFSSGFGRPGGRKAPRLILVSPWMPQVDCFHRDGHFVIRADLPGFRKDGIVIEILDDMLTIQGERRDNHDDERDSDPSMERTHGTFYRIVRLPEAAVAESAKASFADGVLEVTLRVPARARTA